MIGYYVHHHGRGHITRAARVVQHLESPVTGFSSLPRPAGWPGEWVELPDDDTASPDEQTAGGVLHWAPLRHRGYSERMATLSRHMAGLDLFVVDVSVEVSLLARLHGVPVVVVAMRGDRSDGPHRLAYDSATALLVPWSRDFPEQWWPEHWSAKSLFVGAISRFDDRRPAIPERDARRRALVLLGGGGHDLPDHAVSRAAAHTPDWAWTLRSVASPSPDLWEELLGSDVVVSHGGNNAVAEVAAARRPAIVVAQERPFREQHHTVAVLERAGICVGLDEWPQPEAWSGLFDRAQALGTSKWEIWNPRDGAQRAARHLEDLMARQMA